MNDIRNQLNECKILHNVIYADPPWSFKTYSDKGKEKSADNHYLCMSLEEIKSLPINHITNNDCILFLWVTGPMLPLQIEVATAWGFTYKTVGFNWVKLNKKSKTPFIGLGYYTRSNPEWVLICTKGTPGRPKDKSISSVILSEIREHSRKPDEIIDYIERMYDGPYCELFARQQRPNWTCLGNQVEKFKEEKSLLDTFYET